MKKALITVFLTLAMVTSLGSFSSFSHIVEAKITQNVYDPGH
ncbi:hypothetical protein [Brevibacillus laterosporus]|uniref:Phr family secreted Rap phosphatase inhibitor n=1 Tax=Brevibacillus laterosporus TaxID=1465 RepID=A0AAP3DLT7_BRELA|nr:hypothetical protein [Brevibacillus laterosporus]MCR8982871.1 hypothetical protein [Brevibacillus laterosporus]MCZ0810027.1 hypothetical protein [Brevibacillus laterosporus]MCZ0828661.1 hypothetical protein [Brevibacillus laterosporus]MCZ0852704.1 hypothetical protein [Brevibacillus laterosporus]